MRDADRLFHELWLGLAQPFEGLVFSVPVLADAQITPAARPQITAQLLAQLEPNDNPERPRALTSVRRFFEDFLGYQGALLERDALPSFYAPEAGQEIRPSFALAAQPPQAPSDDPFAEFDQPTTPTAPEAEAQPLALVWDLSDDCDDALSLSLDAPEDRTGPWRYPPTAKLERLLRHSGVPVGFLSNRRELRLIYAPAGETTSHLTFRLSELADPAGRPLLLALELLFHARRSYSAEARFTFAGLLAESRRRQADVTEQLAVQVKSAIESLLAGFESAAKRDLQELDWLRAALEAEHMHQGVLDFVLRLVFVLYAEDRSLLPVEHPLYASQLSLLSLYERLLADASAHPESMTGRYGAYAALIALFRGIYFGVQHRDLQLPARQGKLFDPNEYPFLEGGLPGWTAAVHQADERARVRLPLVDDGTVLEVLHQLIVLDGQRLSYRDLSVEQIGAVYESLMGYRVLRIEGPAVRLGKSGYWLELEPFVQLPAREQSKLLADRGELSATAQKNLLALLATPDASLDQRATAIAEGGRRGDRSAHVARAGQLVLQPTSSRRSTGSHYTPRALTERVVRRTLAPVLACLGAKGSPQANRADGSAGEQGEKGSPPSAAQILSLKVCDPAMGSGAFLVEACRFLADQVVEAWRRSGELPKLTEQHGDVQRFAKRLVAERCLYGVDKNPAAVELAKLSLWLETMSADRSFTFLDHVLVHGDSLVGLDLEQIRSFHWAPSQQVSLVRGLVDRAMEEIRDHREQILKLAGDESARAQRDKRRLLELAEQAQRRVQLVADACVGAFFSADKPKAREAERLRRLDAVEHWLAGDESYRAEVEAWSVQIREQHAPLHWHLQWPEVFYLQRPDPLAGGEKNQAAMVDAFVGNPPFMGVTFIPARIGEGYVSWLQHAYPGTIGKFDMCASFFRRCGQLLGAHGSFGLIATNTIAQGDTRATGLQHLLEHEGFEIFDATRSLPWPGDAAVTVSVVLLAKGHARDGVAVRRLDDTEVSAISSQLGDSVERADPSKLFANADTSFLGAKIYGEGFTLTPEERDELIAKNKRNAERIFPYLGGQEVNSSPTQSHDRYVISFGGMSLEEAEAWPDLLAIVREKVKPERNRLRDNADGRKLKAAWWQFGRTSPGLYAALAELPRCLVNSRVSKHLMFTFQPADRVLSEQLYAYPLPAFTTFAVLQSRVHEPWARLLSSTMEDRLRYAASDCFETFPFPAPDPRTTLPALEAIGAELTQARADYMLDTAQGLTKTYNQLKDPACSEPRILALRALHEAMDRAVLEAYGWSDLAVPPFCPLTPADEAALERFKAAVIERLFALNASRAAEEARLGLAKPVKAKAKPKKRAPTEAAPSNDTPAAKSGKAPKPKAAKQPRATQAKLFSAGANDKPKP